VRFLEPEDQARVEALEAALRELPLGEASRRIEDGDVIDVRSGKRIAWEPAALVLPVSPRLRARLDAPERAAALEAALERHAYRLAPLRRSGRRAGTPRARQAPAGSSPPPRR
jgi:hypothetical protein